MVLVPCYEFHSSYRAYFFLKVKAIKAKLITPTLCWLTLRNNFKHAVKLQTHMPQNKKKVYELHMMSPTKTIVSDST